MRALCALFFIPIVTCVFQNDVLIIGKSELVTFGIPDFCNSIASNIQFFFEPFYNYFINTSIYRIGSWNTDYHMNMTDVISYSLFSEKKQLISKNCFSEKTIGIRLDTYAVLVDLFRHVDIKTLIDITMQLIASGNESPRSLGLPRISLKCFLLAIILKSFDILTTVLTLLYLTTTSFPLPASSPP